MKTRNYYIVRVERDSLVEQEFVFLSAKKAERYREELSEEYPDGDWRIQDDGSRVYEFDLARIRGGCESLFAGAISIVVVEGEAK